MTTIAPTSSNAARAGAGTASPSPTPARRLPAGYGYEWARFVDWCAATDHTPLPAHPVTLAEFLDEHPAPPATQRRRLAAITWTHTAAGHPSPARAGVIRALLHPVPELTAHQAAARDAAERARLTATTDALLRLPTAGWPNGLFGRRDALLLVLTHHGRLPYEQVSRLRRDQVRIGSHHDLLIDRGPDDQLTLPAAEDPRRCPACIHHRWTAVLDFADRHPSSRSLRSAVHRASPVTASTPHADTPARHASPGAPAALQARASGSPTAGGADPAATDQRPLLTAIDGWGYLPWQPAPLTAKAVARIVTDHLTGRAPGHRTLPVTEQLAAAAPAAVPAVSAPRPLTDPAERASAAAHAAHRRRRDHDDLTAASAALTNAETRIQDLLHRTLALLESAEPPPRPTKRS